MLDHNKYNISGEKKKLYIYYFDKEVVYINHHLLSTSIKLALNFVDQIVYL